MCVCVLLTSSMAVLEVKVRRDLEARLRLGVGGTDRNTLSLPPVT